MSTPEGTQSTRRLVAMFAAATGLEPLFATLAGDWSAPPPALVLTPVVLASGLRRGRRFAWWAALAVSGVWALVGLHALVVPAVAGLWAVASALPAVALAVLLLQSRAAFRVPAPAGTYRRLTGTALVSLTVLWGLCAPFGVLTAAPGGAPLRSGAGTVFCVAMLAAVLVTFRRHRTPGEPGDRHRARRLLESHSGGVLSFMTTWPDNRYWFTGDGRAGVAYRLVGSVALTVADPFGDPAAVAGAVQGFTAFCADHGWTPCFYSVSQPLAADLSASGWRLIQVAQDAQVPLPGLRFTGRRWQDVRTALNRARREGIVAEWVAMRHAPAAVTGQIRSICAAWLAERRLPEMTFTLGGFDELTDDAVRCLVAMDGQGRIHAVTSWLPVYRDGTVVGWTLDVMRRGPATGNGVMDFLIASAALRFQEEGFEFLSLSGTPLAHADRTLARVGRLLEPLYGFRALLAFKAKFQPVYHPLYLAYPRAGALPAIATAVARAYLPRPTPAQLLLIATAAVRGRRRHVPATHAGTACAPPTETGEMSWVPGRW